MYLEPMSVDACDGVRQVRHSAADSQYGEDHKLPLHSAAALRHAVNLLTAWTDMLATLVTAFDMPAPALMTPTGLLQQCCYASCVYMTVFCSDADGRHQNWC